jgi:sugar lactone lactonase YvrE
LVTAGWACNSGSDTTAAGGGGDDGVGAGNDGGGGNTVGNGGGADCSGAQVDGADLPDVVHPVAGTVVTTIAGSSAAGDDDGQGSAAKFDDPVNVRLVDGELLIADFNNGSIRRSTLEGEVTTLTHQNGFARPFGMAMVGGALLVETDFDDQGENAGESGGVVWRVNLDTGVATALSTNQGRPRGLVATPDGKLFMTDVLSHDIRLMDPSDASVSTIAGGDGCPGYRDAAGADARFNRPYGVARTASGDYLVADQNNNVIRRVSASGEVSTLAGDGVADMIDGPVATARFNMPQGVAVDGAGNVYVTDIGNHRIRRIGVDGQVTTIAGNGTAGFADGAGTAAEFYGIEGLDVTADGKTIYVADGTNGEVLPYHRIRKITVP